MSRHPIDLYLGAEIGLWVLDQVQPAQVGLVITSEPALASAAKSRSLSVTTTIPDPAARASNALSVHYPTIFPTHVLTSYNGAYNLHPGYLPWGRGFYPIFWALLQDTPAGATLHQMTEHLDGGPIVDQIQVPYTESDTGGSLLTRVRDAEKSLFHKHWPILTAGQTLPTTKQNGTGSYHSRADFYDMKRPATLRGLDAETLIKRIRCLTVPNYTGLELSTGDARFHLTLQQMT